MQFKQTEEYKTLCSLIPAVCELTDDCCAGLVKYAIAHSTWIIHETVLAYGTSDNVNNVVKAMEYLEIKPVEGLGSELDAVPAANSTTFGNQYTTQEELDSIDVTLRGQWLRREILAYLIKKAFTGQTSTYVELATEFGLPNRGNQMGTAIAPILRDLVIWCQLRGIPPIPALVVRKTGGDAGIPGSGFWPMVNLNGLSRTAKIRHTARFHAEIYNYFAFNN